MAPGRADGAMDPEQVKKLQRELEEAQETLRAIRQGEVDGLVVDGPNGPQLFTLKSAEQPYRMLVEQMQEGALTLTPAGDILYCNRRFAGSVLGQSSTPEHDRRARDVIAHQTEHLTRLVGDLLDVTRGALGKIELVRTVIDVAAVVRQCVATLESTERLVHHAVVVEAEPVWVEADQARLEQIVMNLLSNSLKFTPRGGAIKVIVRRERDEAVLEVADDGSGISADLLPSVFDLFVQGDRHPDRQSAGLGVGLTLVRRLVELHCGRVEAARPWPGRGSVFTVRLPALIDTPQERGHSVVAPADAPRRRILVVEDNADNREMMRMLLEASGHEIHEAADGVLGR